MPSSKEILSNALNSTMISRKDALTPFQIECLNMFKKKIEAIPVDAKTEMDLRICGVLLDECFCDFAKIFGSEHRILSLVSKNEITNNDFYEKVSTILDGEIKKLNKEFTNSFYDQTFKAVKTVLIDLKGGLDQLKKSLDQRLEDAASISHAEYQKKYG